MSDIDEFDLSFLYLICVTFARVKINSQRILVVTDKNVQGAEGGGGGGGGCTPVDKEIILFEQNGFIIRVQNSLKT